MIFETICCSCRNNIGQDSCYDKVNNSTTISSFERSYVILKTYNKGFITITNAV